MRIALDARPAADPRGVGRYVRSLLDALRATAEGREVVESCHPRRVDVFHSPWLAGVRVRTTCPQVVTLHDLVALKRRGEYLRTGVRYRLRYKAAERAARLIVPTEAVARDAVELLGVDRSRVAVIPVAPDAALRPSAPEAIARVRERYDLPGDYLLWVGQRPQPRRRVVALAEAPRTLPLVIVGPAREWAHDLPDVALTGQVPGEDLAAIYTGARAVVLPAEDESFGLPALEALACGTPVVAGDDPGLRELLGARATFVEPDDVASLVAAAERARRPAPEPPTWTWLDAARATWRVYEDALA